jgi:6-pyruvoyltetrahydropterin/6-carboxytetrahydropterin synthase
MTNSSTAKLARRAYFSIGRRLFHPDWDDALNTANFRHLARAHGHDCVLLAFYAGEPGARDGMIANLSDIKPLLAEATAPLDGKMLDCDLAECQATRTTAENKVESLWARLPLQQSTGHLIRLVLELTARLRVEKTPDFMRLTRSYEFAAAHRLCAPHLDDAQNAALYGKCSNRAGHGHNYRLEVTVEGTPDAQTGFLISPWLLDGIVEDEIFARFDHRHLNEDCPEFKDLIPTSENFARVIFDLLRVRLAAEGHNLARVGLHETQKNFFEVEA